MERARYGMKYPSLSYMRPTSLYPHSLSLSQISLWRSIWQVLSMGLFLPSRSGKSLSKLREKNKIRVIHDDLKVWRDLFRKWDNPLRREVNLFEWIWDTGKKKFSRNSRSLSRHPSFQRRTIISCIPAIYYLCTPFFLAGFAHERGNALICIGFANVGTRDPDPVYRIIPLVK